ncbi:leucine-rich repeat-containing protein 63 isoform X2 [Ornithorhynchus anatinus]|uniref:leucine-rich repeat-containing protein 63 isoform X2 n=1 Tax=Ornithorhynchus anatinus TaxID=9258 RepID=UPI0019D45F4D|nr:leucine-rich repeat-containing protein 63 isoform X2 [Ornithorhynchus anatinus]
MSHCSPRNEQVAEIAEFLPMATVPDQVYKRSTLQPLHSMVPSMSSSLEDSGTQEWLNVSTVNFQSAIPGQDQEGCQTASAKGIVNEQLSIHKTLRHPKLLRRPLPPKFLPKLIPWRKKGSPELSATQETKTSIAEVESPFSGYFSRESTGRPLEPFDSDQHPDEVSVDAYRPTGSEAPLGQQQQQHQELVRVGSGCLASLERTPPAVRKERKATFDLYRKSRAQAHVRVKNLLIDWNFKADFSTKPEVFAKPGYRDFNLNFPENRTPIPRSLFFPPSLSAATRVFGKSRRALFSRIQALEQPKGQSFSIDKTLSGILVISSKSQTPANFQSQRHYSPDPFPRLRKSWKEPDTYFDHHKPERPWNERLRKSPQTEIHIQLLKNESLSEHILERKPHIQAMIEIASAMKVTRKLLSHQKKKEPQDSVSTYSEEESKSEWVRGIGYKSLSSQQYDGMMAIANLAVFNCRVHGRTALNLKAFFLPKCPALTPLSHILLYLNLSFNDLQLFPEEVFCLENLQVLNLRSNPIKEIPSKIRELQKLKTFTISFNLISLLPPGLFLLPSLQLLDISYNCICVIPEDIRHLRTLEVLNVEGNELVALPSSALKLHLKKIFLDNTFTHPLLWRENSRNSAQRLIHLASLCFAQNHLWQNYKVLPQEAQKILLCFSLCDYCQGPMYGKGLQLIRPYNIFGISPLPFMFHVCCSSCYRNLRFDNQFLTDFLGKK